MIESTPETRSVPNWLIGLVVALALAGGGYLVWTSLFSGPVHQSGVIRGEPAPVNFGYAGRPVRQQGGGGAPNWLSSLAAAAQRADGIIPNGANAWTVRSGSYALNVSKPDPAGKPTFAANFTGAVFLTPEQNKVMVARNRITVNPDAAKAVGVNPDDVPKLRSIKRIPLDMPLDADARAKLETLWQAYQSAQLGAPQDAAKKDLLAGLTEIGKSHSDAASKVAQPLVEQVSAILTPEQIEKAFAWRPAAPAPAAPQPAK